MQCGNVLKHFPFLLPMDNLRKLVIMIKKEYKKEDIAILPDLSSVYVADVAAKK